MKKIKTILIVFGILAILGFALYSVGKSKFDAYSELESTWMESLLSSYTVKTKDMSTCIRSSGSITSFNIEMLDIEAGSKVTELLVNEGDKVNSKQEILKITDVNGKTKTIKSTISGMFFCVESQTEGTQYCIYNLDDIGVKVPLSEKDIVAVKLGQKSKIKIDALKQEFEGTVSYISSLPQNEKYVVKIKIDYNDDIKFGYKALTSIITSEKSNVMAIPYDCARMEEDGRYYVIKDEFIKDIAELAMYGSDGIPDEFKTYIEVGEVTSQNIEVVSGLNEGDKIILSQF